ncbi:GNAT family N-acetyltransferase [Dyadobacter sp. CY343]|uniref:GNAT family N-acetyltransferase n=1 Tax=Dyadobacter sp. CY343 TaxID=2907299 RepID=UPI001F2F2377|nr:GNAT family N-acetyltransferase [Dyadobacter sp. CY343]MCE7059617.1 GNAT family N-acetyltransferase [Dyadobacter sp. CY343]
MSDYTLNSITISDFEEEEREAVARLYENSYRATFTWFNEEQLGRISFDSDTEGEFILVAKSGEEIVGFASLWVPGHFIHHLYVDAARQHQGIGKALLHKSLQKLSGKATLKCLVKNRPAVDFYLRNEGFRSQVGDSEDGEYILFEWKETPISG